MIKIRKSVFETNSSSSHSLVVSKRDRGYDYDLPVDENGILTIPFGEFGWGPAVLNTPIEKLSYLITDRGPYRYDDDNYSWDTLMERVKEDANINEIIKVVKAACPKVKEIEFSPASSYYPLGYVDHDSCGTSYHNGLSIEEIAFNKSVIIIIDNDNSCNFEDYFEDWNGNPASKDIEDLF